MIREVVGGDHCALTSEAQLSCRACGERVRVGGRQVRPILLVVGKLPADPKNVEGRPVDHQADEDAVLCGPGVEAELDARVEVAVGKAAGCAAADTLTVRAPSVCAKPT